MNCERMKENLPLFLYGELSFDEEELCEQHLSGCAACARDTERERALHKALDDCEREVPRDLLVECRQGLHTRLREASIEERSPRGIWPRLELAFGDWLRPAHGFMRPAAAVALVLVGFYGARLTNQNLGAHVNQAGMTGDPVTSRVRYVEPDASGQVQIVVDETRQRVLSGRADDERIRPLLLSALRDPNDPGLRGESLDILKARPESSEVRSALLNALEHDACPGVRLKALEGLKAFSGEAETRLVLARVLLKDNNPGLRTQAIDMLIQNKPGGGTIVAPQGMHEQLVGVLQELMRKEDNSYVRQRCQKALQDMNASVETY